MAKRDECGFALDSDYDEDREERTCRRVERVKLTGDVSSRTGKPRIYKVCRRCADTIQARLVAAGYERYLEEAI